jgi:hypothetical protein
MIGRSRLIYEHLNVCSYIKPFLVWLSNEGCCSIIQPGSYRYDGTSAGKIMPGSGGCSGTQAENILAGSGEAQVSNSKRRTDV